MMQRLRLNPSALLTWPVFAFSFLWTVIAHFTDIANNGIDHVWLRLALLVLVQLVFFCFPLAVWHLVCPRVSPDAWIRLLIVAIIFGAAVRGAVFGLLLFRAGLTEAPQYAFRILTSVANMATVTVLLWFVVSEVRELQLRRRLLLADRDQLLALQSSAQEGLDSLGSRATEEIRTLVLASLGTPDGASASDVLRRLRFTIDDVVRPLSQRLAVQGATWVPPRIPARPMRVNWLEAVREGLTPSRIRPLVVTLALIWLGLPVHAVQYGPKYAFYLLGTAVVGFPAFWLLRKGAMAVSAGRGAEVRILAFTCAVLLGGESMGLASLVYMHSQPKPYLFVIMVPIFALLISAPLAVAEQARDQSLVIEAELVTSTSDLRWALARTREQHRQQERALAHALHGRIQASLASAIVRLDRAVEAGIDDPSLVAALQREVSSAVDSLDHRIDHPDPIEQVIELTRSNWAGAAEIDFRIPDDARRGLDADVLCANAVNDLIPELVFNSFRHGKASRITIDVHRTEARTLELVVLDNGNLDPRSTRQGLGTQLLDTACIQWTRGLVDGHTQTVCLLPCTGCIPN